MSLATSYCYGLMRRAFGNLDKPRHLSAAVEKEIAIRDDRLRVEAERVAARGIISRVSGLFV